MFKIRSSLVIVGGSAKIGSDTNLYRSAANRLSTDDALMIGGSATVTGNAVFSALVTCSGTSLAVPYGTSSPSPIVNGNVNVYHKGNVARLVVRSGGTTYSLAFPTATDGTATITVGSPP